MLILDHNEPVSDYIFSGMYFIRIARAEVSFGFEGRIWVLIDTVPSYCLRVTSKVRT